MDTPIIIEVDPQQTKTHDELMKLLRDNKCVYGMLWEEGKEDPSSYVLPESVLDYNNPEDARLIDEVFTQLPLSQKQDNLFVILSPIQVLALPRDRFTILALDAMVN